MMFCSCSGVSFGAAWDSGGESVETSRCTQVSALPDLAGISYQGIRLCSGIFASATHVVTAAHCVEQSFTDPSELEVLHPCDAAEPTAHVESIDFDARYRMGDADYDVALLTLDRPIECASRATLRMPDRRGSRTTVVSLRRGPHSSCATVRLRTGGRPTLAVARLTQEPRGSVSHPDADSRPVDRHWFRPGDSGSPILDQDGGRWVVIGVLVGGVTGLLRADSRETLAGYGVLFDPESPGMRCWVGEAP
jgi:hypothetical protein